MEIFNNPNFDFLGKKYIWIAISLILITAGVITMFTKGIPLGIDFRGGADVQLKFREAPKVDDLRAALHSAGFGTVTIQRFGAAENNEVLIRLDPHAAQGKNAEKKEEEDIATDILTALRSNEEKQEAEGKTDLNSVGEEDLKEALASSLGAGREEEAERAASAIVRVRNAKGIITDVKSIEGLPEISTDVAKWLNSKAMTGRFAIRSVDYVGPAVGSDLRRKARWAVLFSLTSMLIYIGFRFHAASYGVAAILSLTHDVLITLGFISFFQKEFDLTVLAAILTIVGYSVNDTIVVFDRVRDNLRLHRRAEIEKVFNDSINQTLSRTIITSLLVFMVLLCIWIFGGSRLEPFSFSLLVGVVTGTYSSIYIAAPIVIVWNRFSQRKAGRTA